MAEEFDDVLDNTENFDEEMPAEAPVDISPKRRGRPSKKGDTDTKSSTNEHDAKLQALNTALASIDKQFGKGSVMKLGDTHYENIEAISTGSLSLDHALGIGGLPRGRIIEIFGPESSGKTTLALSTVREVQEQGGIAMYIDAEHALDPKFAREIGVNVDELYISQPDSGEQALEIAESVVRSGAVDIVVIDSVAALTPKAEIDGEMGDSHVGLQARLMSQALRKLTGIAAKSKTTIIFINQLREKVGVMFGCLHADTMIPFTDGRAFPIRKIVEEKIEGSVWSYNEKTGTFEEKEIIDWHYNGDVIDNADYIHIETGLTDSKNGKGGITVTPTHKVMTEAGWKEAKDLTIQDKILSKYHSVISGTLQDFIYGMCCGDSHFSIRNRNTASLRIQDSSNQEYVDWKINKLKPFYDFSWVVANNRKRFQTKYCSEFAILKRTIGERNPLAMLDGHYSDMALAIWYMDDGNLSLENSHKRATISVKRFVKDQSILNQIENRLSDLGLECAVEKKSGSIRFNVKSTQLLMEKIAKFVPECMQYKLLPEYRGKYKDFTLTSCESEQVTYVPITMIRHASDKQMRQKGKYDLSIKDNHTYLAGGITNGLLVHNSPETTAGGRALKFYASVRLDIRKVESIKKNNEVVANHVRVKVVKNKVSPPFRQAEFDIYFKSGTGHAGIDTVGDVFDLAVAHDVIEKSGAWFSYEGEKIGQGRENAKNFLIERPELLDEITEQVKELIASEQ